MEFNILKRRYSVELWRFQSPLSCPSAARRLPFAARRSPLAVCRSPSPFAAHRSVAVRCSPLTGRAFQASDQPVIDAPEDTSRYAMVQSLTSVEVPSVAHVADAFRADEGLLVCRPGRRR